MVLGDRHDVSRSGVLGQPGEEIRIEMFTGELGQQFRRVLVLGYLQARLYPAPEPRGFLPMPCPASRTEEPPMDEQTEARFAPPLHPSVALGIGRFACVQCW